MHVLHLMNTLQPSGMERMLQSGAAYLASSGVRSTLLAQGQAHPYAQQLREAGFAIRTVPPLRTARGALAYSRMLAEVDADLLHVHAESAFAVSVLLAGLVKPAMPIVRTVHNIFDQGGRARLSRRTQSLVADRRVARFIAPSPDVQEIEERFGRNLTMIYNWVDDSYSASAAAGSPDQATAVIVGNCSPVKNHAVALEALSRRKYKIHHFGSETDAPSDETRILNDLEEKGLLLHRGQGDPLEAMRSASVFVMPSLREGMGVALAEALSVGLPCLVSDVPGLQWAKGLEQVVSVEPTPEAWRAAVAQLPAVDARAQPAALPDFSARRGIEQYVAVYMQALERGSVSPGHSDE